MSKNHYKELWVSPEAEKGTGTFEEPYTLRQALERVQPGNTIILKHGTYKGDVTVQSSGTIDKPIRITTQENAVVEINGGCWYFYDTSDLIVSGLVFRESPSGAVALMGECVRNNFHSLKFQDCCNQDRASSSFFIGGSGAQCNVIEHCFFTRSADSSSVGNDPVAVGIMIAEGDADQQNGLIRDHVIRYNCIENYDCGIMVGTRGNGLEQFGHVIENNVVRNCRLDGIKVNCGDTEIKGNTIRDCENRGIWIATGCASSIENNRLERCSTGIQVLSAGHIIQNNCIVDSMKQSVHVTAIPADSDVPKSTIIIEQNSFIQHEDESYGDFLTTGILMDSLSSCVIRKNLISGQRTPYMYVENDPKQTVTLIQDNGVSGKCEIKEGCAQAQAAFVDPDRRNFISESGYGAQGWVATAETDKVLSIQPGEGEPREFLTEDELTQVERLITDVDSEEIMKNSFFNPEDEENYEEE